MEPLNFEYQLAQATLKWLVAIKILSPAEAQKIDELNLKSFCNKDARSTGYCQ